MTEAVGAPFHPESQAPRAPCPLCSAEKGDKSPKALFAIHGFKKGEYDGQIPDDYFLVPPMQLGGGDASLQAMRVSNTSPFTVPRGLCMHPLMAIVPILSACPLRYKGASYDQGYRAANERLAAGDSRRCCKNTFIGSQNRQAGAHYQILERTSARYYTLSQSIPTPGTVRTRCNLNDNNLADWF